ncbi:MAG: ribonuclease HI [Nitrospinae bacterium]|nr:ribonuclease HI [Nitrospinota bacterium]
MTESRPAVEIHCDGACRGNPGPGGWGALLRSGEKIKELYGYKPHTTNNEMELTGAIEGLNALKLPSRVALHTDSSYVVKGMTEWIKGWKRNGWMTSTKQPVKNKPLWQALEAAAARHTVRWVWVKGHAGNRDNERADELANRGIDEAR